MDSVEMVIGRIPKVTKALGLLILTTTILCSLDILTPFQLYLNWNLIAQGQVWRLFTCFLYFGSFGVDLLWNAYVLVSYSSMLEENYYHDKPADYVWILLNACGILLVLSFFFDSSFFLISSVLDIITYIIGRRQSSTRVRVFFLTIRASYLPYLFILSSLLLNQSIKSHLIAIFTAHIIYFFDDVYPYLSTSKGRRIFSTPTFFKKLFNQPV